MPLKTQIPTHLWKAFQNAVQGDKLYQHLQELCDQMKADPDPGFVSPQVVDKFKAILQNDSEVHIKCLACNVLAWLAQNKHMCAAILKKGIAFTLLKILKKEIMKGGHVMGSATSDLHEIFKEQASALLFKLSYFDAFTEGENTLVLTTLIQLCDMRNLANWGRSRDISETLKKLLNTTVQGQLSDMDTAELKRFYEDYFGDLHANMLLPDEGFQAKLHKLNSIETGSTEIKFLHEQLIEAKLAVPVPVLRGTCTGDQNSAETDPWVEVWVTHIVDGVHFWVVLGGTETYHKLTCVKACLEQIIQDERPIRKKPQIGQFVCATHKLFGSYRAQIISVQEDMVRVFALDLGFIAVLPWNTLRYISKMYQSSVSAIPAQARLCKLPGIALLPASEKVMQNLVGSLCNCSTWDYITEELNSEMDWEKSLFSLCQFPHVHVCRLAVAAVSNFARNRIMRQYLGKSNAVEVVLDVVQGHVLAMQKDADEPLMLLVLTCLGALSNLLLDFQSNKEKFFKAKGVPVSLLLATNESVHLRVKRAALKLLKTFTGHTNLLQLDLHVNCEARDSPGLDGAVTHGQVGRKSMDSDIESSRRARRRRSDSTPRGRSPSVGEERRNSQTTSIPRPRSRSLSRRRVRRVDDSQRTLRMARLDISDSSSDEEDAVGCVQGTEHTVTSGEDTEGETVMQPAPPRRETDDELPVKSRLWTDSSKEQQDTYGGILLLGQLCGIRSDGTHDLRKDTDINSITQVPLVKLICAFLNAGAGGSIYFGIRKTGVVRGMKLTRDQRDCFRQGVDQMMSKLSPPVVHSVFHVVYHPILEQTEDPSEQFKVIENLSVIEIWIQKNYDKVYTVSDGQCYVREGTKTLQVNTQYIYERALLAAETDYQQQIASIQVEIDHIRHGAKLADLRGSKP